MTTTSPQSITPPDELGRVWSSALHVASYLREHVGMRGRGPTTAVPHDVRCERCGRSFTIGYRDGILDFWGEAVTQRCRVRAPRARRE